MAERYKIQFTTEEYTQFRNAGAVGVPMSQLKAWLNLGPDKRNAPGVATGIPKDTVLLGNELGDWLLCSKIAYKVEEKKDAIIAIKGDKSTDYPAIKTVIKTFELRKILRFNFVTSLEGKEDAIVQ